MSSPPPEAPDGHEYVKWAVQPDRVTLYVMSETGNKYRVRNAHERILIDQADRPELEMLGYIAPKE